MNLRELKLTYLVVNCYTVVVENAHLINATYTTPF